MSDDVRLTEERLRTWLDGNQPGRERLCVQVLSLNRRFRNVRARQPKGGPDGGFDIDAQGDNGERVVGAIGFRNSPNDGPADQRWVRKKFRDDILAAIRGAGDFKVFVFFTNVRLSVGVRQKLLILGRTLTEAAVEIIDREQIRLALDTPEGLASRYQFLQIPLSDAEQAAFFSRWGADLEHLVATSFAAVEERLHRLEFLHERERRLFNLSFSIRLKEATAIAGLPHVRAVLSVWKLTRTVRKSQWHVGVCNNSDLRKVQGCGIRPCLAGGFWLASPKILTTTSASFWPDPFRVIGASGGFGEFSKSREVATLGDLDDAFIVFFMNRRLFESTESIHVHANEYLIWSAAASELAADAPNEDPETPWLFTQEELADDWVRVMPKDLSGSIHFSSSTPRRMWNAQRLEQAK